MDVVTGWSGQTGSNPDRWAKASVRLDEHDLRRLLQGLAVGELLDELVKVCPPSLTYQLLEIQGEILLKYKLMNRHGYPLDKGQAEIRELDKTKKAVFDQIRQVQAQ